MYFGAAYYPEHWSEERWEVDTRLMQALLAWLCLDVGVEAVLRTPPGVHAYERRSAAHRLVFLLNFSEQAQVVALDEPWEDGFTGKQVEQVALDLAGVAIIRHSRS